MFRPQELKRLEQDASRIAYWRRWGPYLSERQWGTVREDYSEDGSAWQSFSFEQSHHRAYRWGEDGIGGICDNHQRICFAFSFWNGKDPFLKERLFGLGGNQGNHGEDVKEIYFHLENVPSHSYMRYLYKYPIDAFPYQTLVEKNRDKIRNEYDPQDLPLFQKGRYIDLFITYAKKTDEDLFIQLEMINQSREKVSLHILPTLWFRNTWSWESKNPEGKLHASENHILCDDPYLGRYYFKMDRAATTLFTDNETRNGNNYAKDGFHQWLIHQNTKAVRPEKKGTKACFYLEQSLDPQEKKQLFLFLGKKKKSAQFSSCASLFAKRKKEAEKFYSYITPHHASRELATIQRQAFYGLLWSKQFYHFVVEDWLEGDRVHSSSVLRKKGRNAGWKHVFSDDILSIPDKWEYPWFATWDTAFHAIVLGLIDPWFAKVQLKRLTREWYMHPNGQIPAYEWNFSDVNPPVHAWAAWRVFKMEQRWYQKRDTLFLSSVFQKLLLNFTWWVNRKDAKGKNVFEGGFLGLDNISIFNRSEQLPRGASLTQADASSWMGMFCLNMLTIALELAKDDSSYEDMASKFFEHFLYIAKAMHEPGSDHQTLWHEKEGFYYDLLHESDGTHKPIKLRSIAGFIPLFAVAVLEEKHCQQFSGFYKRFSWFIRHKKSLCAQIASLEKRGIENRILLALVDETRLRKLLQALFDEEEFLSPYGIRSLSKYHEKQPFVMEPFGELVFEPGETVSSLFGGNSNWRGPIWFPLNYLIIESLQKYHHYLGSEFLMEFPTGSGKKYTLWEIAGKIAHRLMRLFLSNQGKIPLFGQQDSVYTKDPHFKGYYLFFEYFHAETGKGLGAAHQTGWTALIAKLIQQYGFPKEDSF